MVTRKPAETFAPGDFLKEELEARAWTQSDLAEILDRPVAVVNEIIAKKRRVTPETARGLAAAFGTSAEYWMNLESSFQLSKIEGNDSAKIARRAKLYGKAPIKEMIRRGWIEESENLDVLEARLLKFFQIESIDDELETPLHAARKSTSYSDGPTTIQKVWLYRARQLAKAVNVGPYSKASFDKAIAELRSLLESPAEIRRIPRILADAGIRLIIIQPLSGSRIDGSYFWAHDAPTIALSLRFDRIDNFWFVLMHELAHVSQDFDSLDVEMENIPEAEGRPKMELEADEFAIEHLVSQRQLASFINRVGPLYSSRRIEAFAHTMKVHPGIVVGQLQHRGEVAYSSFRRTMVPVRDRITSSALTDGWGSTLPAEL